MIIYGILKEWDTGKRMKEYTVKATDINDPTHVVNGTVSKSGKYEIRLNEMRDYLITWSSPGYVDRSVLISTAGPSEKEQRQGFGMHIEAVLLKFKDGVDYSSLNAPFGKAAYDPIKKRYEWDLGYTDSMREAQLKLMEEYKRH